MTHVNPGRRRRPVGGQKKKKKEVDLESQMIEIIQFSIGRFTIERERVRENRSDKEDTKGDR